MLRVFFSYSHKDEQVRDELEVHLAMLKRQGLIESWHDRRIGGGPGSGEINKAIDEELERADVILLLISQHFLNSSYCYERELTRALERHVAGEARLIPIIAEVCDWMHPPLAKLKAIPKDGKAISKYPNQNDAFLEVVKEIRGEAAARGATPARPTKAAPFAVMAPGAGSGPRSSNLRVKKEFTDQDKDGFWDEAFDYIARFFEGSLDEIGMRNPEISGKFRRLTADHFTAEIYRNGKKVSACGIRRGGIFRGRDISYSNDPNATNSMNEAVGVEDDGHMLFLKASGMGFGRGDDKQKLSKQGAAELFWAILIEPLQR